jgi:anti-sigma factor RsiW
VTHPEMEVQVDAYLDGELAPTEAAELVAHVAECPACARFRDERLALRKAIGAQIPRFEAPDTLRLQLRAALREEAGVRPARHRNTNFGRQWMALAATIAAVAFGGWRLGVVHTRASALADEVFTSHVRSLMPGHLSDVVSSDQHTVKPWFNGRLDFSPPVHDFAGRGYPLLGGRLDYLHGREVAALVYGRRQHIINVFLWPEGGPRDEPAPVLRQGYHLLHWTTPEYTYWVASDLGLSELTEFAKLVQLGDSAATAADTQRRD